MTELLTRDRKELHGQNQSQYPEEKLLVSWRLRGKKKMLCIWSQKEHDINI